MTQPTITTQDLYNIATLSDPRFSPDGNRLAYVRTEIDREINGYRSAMWLVPSAGGRPRQFTSGNKRDSAPRWSPDGRWLAFVSDRGDEKTKTQIYLIPTDGGEAQQLTKMENGVGEAVWSPDGRRIAFTSRMNAGEMAAEDQPQPEIPLDPDERKRRDEEKERAEREKTDPRVIRRFAYRAGTSPFDDRTAHLYVVDLDPETGQAAGWPRRLTQDARDYTEPRWMPDGSALLATVNRRPGTDDLFYYPDIVRVPLDGSELRILTGPDTADHNPWPSPDGLWIAYNSVPVAEYGTANADIKVIPALGGEPRVVTTDLDAHARDFCWTHDGMGFYLLVFDRGRIDLYRAPLEGGPVEALLVAERQILAYDLSPNGGQVAFVASTDRAPSDLYVARLDGGHPEGTSERCLVEANASWLAAKTLGQVEDLWYESGDGMPIQGWIVKPPNFDPGLKYPLVLAIHGGPHSMWSRHAPSMWHEWQVQAAAGYVVFASNPRGSDGYGRDFRAAAINRWGEADLPDLLAGVEQVIAQGYVDPDRLVVTGGSYGGFMTAWVISHDDRFKAAVAQRGVYDHITFYNTTDIPRFTERELASAPWEDPQQLWEYSPLAYVERIHTPLLLIHAENDFRVPIATAEGLFVALRRLKREVEMVRYPRDGHELSRSGEPKHRIDRLERIVGWFDRYVKEPVDSIAA